MRTYSAMDGLISGEVYGVAQDPAGRLWFATRRGLVHFDGLNWRVPRGVTRDWTVRGASDVATDVRPDKEPESPCDQDGPCARILVLDDEPEVLRVISRILGRRGHEVTTVEEGSLAVDAYEEAAAAGHPFDAVILDMTIPGGMGGMETLERIRDLDPDVLAVVASGYSDVPAMADPAAHGFAASLNKPFEGRDLERALAEALAGRVLRK